MSKIRSEQELQDAIDDDFAWRFWEIVSLQSLLQNNRIQRFESSIVRSLVVVSYCHWEGFVKSSVKYLLSYIEFLQLSRKQLDNKFLASSLYHEIRGKGVVDSIQTIRSIIEDENYMFSYNIEKLSSADSNLSSQILKRIATYIGLDISSMDTRMNELDIKVLGRRNHMAHGDRDMIDMRYGAEVAEATINLMRSFKSLLQDMITNKEYRK